MKYFFWRKKSEKTGVQRHGFHAESREDERKVQDDGSARSVRRGVLSLAFLLASQPMSPALSGRECRFTVGNKNPGRRCALPWAVRGNWAFSPPTLVSHEMPLLSWVAIGLSARPRWMARLGMVPSWRMLLISCPLRGIFPSCRSAHMRDDCLCLSTIQGSPICSIIISTSFDVNVFAIFV